MQTLIYSNTKSQKLDSFLLETFPSLKLSQLNKYTRENKIKVNRKKVSLSTPLVDGDVITIFILDEILFTTKNKINKFDPTSIVFEDPNLLIVNKPSGLITIDEKDYTNDSLINRIIQYYNNMDNNSITPKLCHRLDTGTSGLVIIAKNDNALSIITDLLKTHKIIKKYKCITFGIPTIKSDTISNYLLKDEASGFVKQYSHMIHQSKNAITKYNVIATSGRFALVDIELQTGRTHQIRVHMSGLDCPILGDSKYGNNTINREMKFKHQALCAYSITLPINQTLGYLTTQNFNILTTFEHLVLNGSIS